MTEKINKNNQTPSQKKTTNIIFIQNQYIIYHYLHL